MSCRIPVDWPQWLIDAIMKLQYSFPLTLTPFSDVAKNVGVSVDTLLSRLQSLKDQGYVRRVGFYVNTRSLGLTPILVGVKTDKPMEAYNYLREKFSVSHAYIRAGSDYNLWIVLRTRNLNDVLHYLEALKGKYLQSFVLAPSVRVYKLSVKYDIVRGVSRSGPYPARPLNTQHVLSDIEAKIVRMVHSLPLRIKPYSFIAKSLGVSEENVLEIVKRLLGKGVLADPGLILNARMLGFNVNAMIIVFNDAKNVCECVASGIEEATHVVLRKLIPEYHGWSTACYFVVHSCSESTLVNVVDKACRLCSAKELEVLTSVRELQEVSTRV